MGRRISSLRDCKSRVIGPDIVMLREPLRQLLHDGAGCPQCIGASHDLADHEVVQKLTDILENMLGAENIAELAMLLSLGVEELVEARSLELAERVCRVAVEALCEQHDHLGISGMSFRRQAAPLDAEIFRKDFRDCQFVAPGCLPRIEIRYSCHGSPLSVIFTPRKILTRKTAR